MLEICFGSKPRKLRAFVTLKACGLGPRVWDLGFRVPDLGFRVPDLGFGLLC